jgi:multidrug resistance efflux pump
LDPDQDPTSSPETFTKLLAAFKVEQDAQVEMFNEKQMISDELYSTMMSHYHESPMGCELFHAWHEALKDFYRCAAEKWELKQAMEEMCVKYVEALKATEEVLRERNAELEREREERELQNRILELEMQNERVASLEAELREAKVKLSGLEA